MKVTVKLERKKKKDKPAEEIAVQGMNSSVAKPEHPWKRTANLSLLPQQPLAVQIKTCRPTTLQAGDLPGSSEDPSPAVIQTPRLRD